MVQILETALQQASLSLRHATGNNTFSSQGSFELCSLYSVSTCYIWPDSTAWFSNQGSSSAHLFVVAVVSAVDLMPSEGACCI